MANTLSSIVERVYWNLSVDEDSKTYDKNIRVIPKINHVYKQILKGEYRDILNDRTIKGGDLRFLRGKMRLHDYPSKTTIQQHTDNAPTINLTDTLERPAQGHAIINGCVFRYFWSNAKQLQSVTWIMWTHRQGACVSVVHQVPTDARKSFELFRVGRDGKLEEMEYIDYKYQDQQSNYYTILGNDTSNEQFVLLCFPRSDSDYRLYYHKKVQDLVNINDMSVFPDDEDMEVMAVIVAGELLLETEKSEHAQTLLNLWYGKLIDFYNNRAEQNRDFRETVKRRKRNKRFYYARRYN